jgi:DNA-binding MarR family transcriptional regulator
MINECQLKNYLFNNNCICWDEKQELYNNLRFYINHTVAIQNSPWAKGSAVISYYKKIGLSVLQKRIIKYLHHHFFQHGSPAYLKMQTLANRLQSTKRAIIRSINRLIERKILHRIHIFSDKYKQTRSIIIPVLPLKIKLINKLHSLNIKRSSLQAKRSLLPKNRDDRLVDKLQESLKKNRTLIDYIFNSNIFYTQHIVSSSKRNNVPSVHIARSKERATKTTSTTISNERKKETMKRIPRYKLTPTPSPFLDKKRITFNNLASSVDFDLFNLPDQQRKNLLNYVAINTFDFNFNITFSDKKLNVKHPVAQREIKQLLSDYLKLFFSNESLNHKVTNKILRYWNSIDNPKFQKHRTDDPNSLIYSRLLILTNYMLKFYYGNDITKFFNVIDQFNRYGSQNHYLANSLKKWKLDHLILLRNQNGTKKYFIADKKKFEGELFKYRSRNKEAAKRWKEIYINGFYRNDKKKGLEQYHQWRNKLDSFLDLLINRLSECRRELYQRNLTQMKVIDGYETDSILADYCDWVSFSIAKRPDIFDLTNYDHFMQFVYQEMRGVRGMQKFWKPIK